MRDLPEERFLNPVWHALNTSHRHFAVSAGETVRYPASVAPFAALHHPTETALRDLSGLLAPDEYVWLCADQLPSISELRCEATMQCLQMVLCEDAEVPELPGAIVPLTCADAEAMVALTDLAFPGFFRARTCEMGDYFGIRIGGDLIAMGGERMMLDGYAEISGVCTHPAHRGKGLAVGLIRHLARKHRREGEISWLHVGAENSRAIALYTRLGFRAVRTVTLRRLCR